MLHVIQSNKTEYLARMLSATIKQKSKAFDVSQILVGSVGMSKWLKINIAEHNNIAAGLEFPFQSSFINGTMCAEKMFTMTFKKAQSLK